MTWSVILFTADVDDLDLDFSNGPENAGKNRRRPGPGPRSESVTPEQLKAGLEISGRRRRGAQTVAEGELRGRPIVSVRPATGPAEVQPLRFPFRVMEKRCF